jgi:transcription elongation factor GreA
MISSPCLFTLADNAFINHYLTYIGLGSFVLSKESFGIEVIMEKVPMTVRGEKLLRDELERLLKLRPQITQAIAEARELGDLKENAEYHAAREEQGICEAQIRDIEYKLSVAQVIDVTKMENSGKVIFGSTVTLIDVDTEEEKRYQIVGDDEAEIKAGRISVSSPIARGLIGKCEGDEVSISTPGGEKLFEIDQVEYL